MYSACVSQALTNAGVHEEFVKKLLVFKAHFSSCDPAAQHLLQRAAEEMLLAARKSQSLIVATKLVSVLMLIGEGYEEIFKENVCTFLNSQKN